MDGFDDLAQRLAAGLGRPSRRIELPQGFARAAVLVALVRRSPGATLLLTERTNALRRHAGEVSFPGGRIEAGEDARAAAVREAQEEVALDPAGLRIIGELDDRPTVTRFIVSPVVALVDEPPPAFRPDGIEVQKVLEIGLDAFNSPGVSRHEWWPLSRIGAAAAQQLAVELAPEELDGAAEQFKVYFFDVAPVTVWGLTARILEDLLDRIRDTTGLR